MSDIIVIKRHFFIEFREAFAQDYKIDYNNALSYMNDCCGIWRIKSWNLLDFTFEVTNKDKFLHAILKYDIKFTTLGKETVRPLDK